jgi:hypothetical protein
VPTGRSLPVNPSPSSGPSFFLIESIRRPISVNNGRTFLSLKNAEGIADRTARTGDDGCFYRQMGRFQRSSAMKDHSFDITSTTAQLVRAKGQPR